MTAEELRKLQTDDERAPGFPCECGGSIVRGPDDEYTHSEPVCELWKAIEPPAKHDTDPSPGE